MRTLLNKITNISFKVAKMILATTVILALNSNTFVYAKGKEKSYYELQAELLYNFADYVKWPDYFSKTKNLCVVEDNPVLPYLYNILREKNKNIILVRKHENDYLEDCTILFVNNYYDGYVERLLHRVKGKPILTFSNIKNFAHSGGIVQFTLRNNRVEFIINVEEMKNSQIKIDNSILSIADTIN